MHCRCRCEADAECKLQNVNAECIADANCIAESQIRKTTVDVSNGLRARGAGPDLRATPTAAYPCVYVAGSEVRETVKFLKNPWRAYEGSGEALGTFGRALGVLLRALGAMLKPL